MKNFDKLYPLIKETVDGRAVRTGVPNTSSIQAELDNYKILVGLREVKFDLFNQMGELTFHSKSEEDRTNRLANEIKHSNEISPLIVVIDDQGPYVLEGGHRFDALRMLAAKSFPAKVVIDLDSVDLTMNELKTLQEMLELNEADVIDNFKKGYSNAKEKAEKAIDDAEEKRQKAVKDAADKFKKDVGKVEDEVKPPAKIDKNATVEYTNKFLDNFFTKFPQFEINDDARDILEKFPDKASLHSAFTAFKKLATRLETLRIGFNKSLVKSNKVTSDQAAKYNQQARVMGGARAPAPPAALVRFVKNEAKFFKRIVNVDDKSELKDSDFKELLALKIKQTAPERVPDAAQALNMLLGYMTGEIKNHADAIKQAAETLDREIKTTREVAKPEIPSD